MAAAAGKARAMSLAAAVRVVAATARPASSAAAAAGVGAMALIVQGEDTAFGSLEWWAYAGISFFLVLFAGIMSGLTLGLMSLGLVELEILQRSGTDAEKAQAGPIRTPINSLLLPRCARSICSPMSGFVILVVGSYCRGLLR
jgi:metal transporter CNNM